jgi:site-specific DNA-methyltransferase (adenine-specific)
MNDIFNENVYLKTETPAFAKHVLPAVPSSEVYLEDCVTALKRYADNHFDLAIVDPPYGINGGLDNRKAIHTKSGNNLRRLGKAGGLEWDKDIPKQEYWEELMRVSKNQIIWGGNYFLDYLGATRCFITWDKMTYVPTMSQIELAWTSFQEHSKLIKINSNQSDRIHVSQKPVKLYDWLLHNYAKQGYKILDTHLGSGSSRIAAYKGGFNFVGFEINQEYYEKQEKRFNDFKSQLRLF